MGLFKKRCWLTPAAPAPNPDPWHYRIVRDEILNGHQIMEIQYLGCTNYDGRKILLYSDAVKVHYKIDPHFSETERSPVARFEPTPRGWALACQLAMLF